MRGVDLNIYHFDYDLTFAALLMNADGEIYHTFGGRDGHDAESHLTIPSMVRVLKAGLTSHMKYAKNPKKRAARKPVRIEQIFDGAPPKKCFHCHNVHDTRARTAGRKRERQHFWPYPDPIQIGIALDTQNPPAITTVAPSSSSARAKLAPGDQIVAANGQPVLTFGDFQRALHAIPDGGGTLELSFIRGDQTMRARLSLKRRWKVADPATYAWRAMKWNRWPKPGFGGKPLTVAEKQTLGLKTEGLAFRVRYIVTWGRYSKTGQRAAAAGIRRGDIVYAVDGENDFADMSHYHSWFRLKRKVGDVVTYSVLRKGQRRQVKLRLERD